MPASSCIRSSTHWRRCSKERPVSRSSPQRKARRTQRDAVKSAGRTGWYQVPESSGDRSWHPSSTGPKLVSVGKRHQFCEEKSYKVGVHCCGCCARNSSLAKRWSLRGPIRSTPRASIKRSRTISVVSGPVTATPSSRSAGSPCSAARFVAGHRATRRRSWEVAAVVHASRERRCIPRPA